MPEKNPNKILYEVIPPDDVLSQCIHCGMCLSVCPTYEITKQERSSPRGRIRMIKSVAEGEMAVTPVFAEEMNFCLDCQACETACPAGVKYGSMVEAARVVVDNAGYGSRLGKIIKKIALKYILTSKSNLKISAKLLYFYQNSGIQKFLHSKGILKIISNNLEEIDKLAPKVSSYFSKNIIHERIKPYGEVKHKVAFLTGCLMDVMFADINKDTIDVLMACNCEIFTPKNQVCCGSLHAHNGDMETAKKLARQNIDAFEKSGYDYLISNSAGCGAFMKEYGHVLKDDLIYSERAKKFSAKIKDITEFLVDIKNELTFSIVEETVTYHDACHLVHTQKISSQPREILNSIPGLHIKNLEESNWCCGSAGIYNITHYNDSMFILERKMNNIKEAKATIVLTGNPGCITQIKYGAEKFNTKVEVLHPVSIIKRALKNKDNNQ